MTIPRLAAVFGILCGVAIAGGVTARGFLEADTETEASPEQMRWLNVIIDVPPVESGLRAAIRPPLSDTQALSVIQVFERESDSDHQPRELEINAEDGKVVRDSLSDRYPDETRAVIDSIRFVSGPPDLWPYVDSGRPARTVTAGAIRYVEPDPASGLIIISSIGYCVTSGCANERVVISNGESRMTIDARDGSILRENFASAADEDAFSRFRASIELVSPTAEPVTPPAEPEAQ